MRSDGSIRLNRKIGGAELAEKFARGVVREANGVGYFHRHGPDAPLEVHLRQRRHQLRVEIGDGA